MTNPNTQAIRAANERYRAAADKTSAALEHLVHSRNQVDAAWADLEAAQRECAAVVADLRLLAQEYCFQGGGQ